MITSPQAVRFSNERVRTLADTVARAFTQVQSFAAEFQAKGLADLIPNDGTVIADGSDTDGRTPITGADVYQMLALADDLLSMASGPNTRLPVVLKAAVNPG